MTKNINEIWKSIERRNRSNNNRVNATYIYNKGGRQRVIFVHQMGRDHCNYIYNVSEGRIIKECKTFRQLKEIWAGITFDEYGFAELPDIWEE